MILQVASAVILDSEGRIFLQKRGPNKEFPGCWETPGGKVEEYETKSEALARELKEELGLKKVNVCTRPIITMAFSPPVVKQEFDISFYACTHELLPYVYNEWGGKEARRNIIPQEDQQEVGWFSAEAALTLITTYSSSVISLPILLRHIIGAGGSEYLQNFIPRD
jgi:mutator protein MutT